PLKSKEKHAQRAIINREKMKKEKRYRRNICRTSKKLEESEITQMKMAEMVADKSADVRQHNKKLREDIEGWENILIR
ncbi:8565_t:CDS:1, partial [Funneliformis geosporum]